MPSDQVRFHGGAPVNVALIVAEPPGVIVVLPLTTAVGALIGMTRDADAEPHVPAVTVTVSVTVPELAAMNVIDDVLAPDVIDPPSMPQEYVIAGSLGTEAELPVELGQTEVGALIDGVGGVAQRFV